MILPTIHLNGTSKESLIESLCEASQAIELAYKALKQTAPHGRDYYPQGPEAIREAIKEHNNRLRLLDEVKNEIDDMTRKIDQI